MTDDDKSTDDMNSLLINTVEALISAREKDKKEIKALKEELADLRDTEKHIILPAYWYVDEETGEKVYDTDEMESVFHDAMVDLGAYNDELRCEGCDKQFGKTESSFPNTEGLAVCVDCLKGEESGEESGEE